MTLVELHLEVNRVADALEKIVFLLEKLVFPPPPAEAAVQQATLDDLHIVTEQDHTRMAAEQMAFAERYRVVPGSEAFVRELMDWEDEQRMLHGENWQAPDWAAAFGVAEGSDRTHRESSPAEEAADRTGR